MTQMKKLVKSENIQYELLSKFLIDNCGVLTFDFVHEEEGGNNSQIIFNVSNIISLSPRKLVMTGSGMINRNKTKKIIVVYKLSTHLFYWIGYYNVAKNTMRQVLNLVLPEGNEGTYLENRKAKIKLFAFINSYIEEVNKSLPQDLKLNYSF
jgi:hypothetical protein